MPVLAEIRSVDVSEFVSRLHVVDGDYSLLDQLLDEKIPQGHALDSRAVSSDPGHVQS